MRIRNVFIAGVLGATMACGSVLDVQPTGSVPEGSAIVDIVSARAVLAGAYDALQSGSYYGEFMFTFGDLSSDNVEHSGTFTSYADADLNDLTTDNGQVEITWDAMYDAINRANVLIARVPGVASIAQDDKDDIEGQAYFIRALTYHNLVRLWGGVPIKTAPVASIEEAANISRATVAEVYTQILADLAEAEARLTGAATEVASLGAVRALRARVMLYRASPGASGQGLADWAAVESAATTVINMSYTLTPVYGNLFGPTGASTSEDIFRLRFNEQDAFSGGYYYLVKNLGGRYEVRPTVNMRNSYEAGDARRTFTIRTDPFNATRFYNAKYPTSNGTEHPHVMRLAETLLIRAEARAMQNNLAGALADYNLLRQRAGLAPHILGVDVTDGATVLTAIARERRSELAFEGDRWADLVRQGAPGIAIMTAHRPSFQGFQILYPIPQNEIDVTTAATGPRLAQNPGY